MHDEETKLVSEMKKIEDRKEFEENEREASKGLQVPPYWKNKTGIHRVSSRFVRDALEKLMVESLCCPDTMKTRVGVYRRREILKNSCYTHRIRSLSTDTKWHRQSSDANQGRHV